MNTNAISLLFSFLLFLSTLISPLLFSPTLSEGWRSLECDALPRPWLLRYPARTPHNTFHFMYCVSCLIFHDWFISFYVCCLSSLSLMFMSSVWHLVSSVWHLVQCIVLHRLDHFVSFLLQSHLTFSFLFAYSFPLFSSLLNRHVCLLNFYFFISSNPIPRITSHHIFIPYHVRRLRHL